MSTVLIVSRVASDRSSPAIEIISPPEDRSEPAVSRTVTPTLDPDRLERMVRLERTVAAWRRRGRSLT